MAIMDGILGDWRLWFSGVIVLFALLMWLTRRTSLHLAAKENKHPGVIEALLSAGADPNARDADGGTPLHWTTTSKHPAVIDALLVAGANPKARDESGKLPFDYAKSNDKLKGTDVYWKLNQTRFDD